MKNIINNKKKIAERMFRNKDQYQYELLEKYKKSILEQDKNLFDKTFEEIKNKNEFFYNLNEEKIVFFNAFESIIEQINKNNKNVIYYMINKILINLNEEKLVTKKLIDKDIRKIKENTGVDIWADIISERDFFLFKKIINDSNELNIIKKDANVLYKLMIAKESRKPKKAYLRIIK